MDSLKRIRKQHQRTPKVDSPATKKAGGQYQRRIEVKPDGVYEYLYANGAWYYIKYTRV